MRRSPAILLGLVLLVACVMPAWAQTTTIYRCIGAHGEPVFSGQPCAHPVVPSRRSAATPNMGFDSVCAASPRELRALIAQAFATHNANRMAGLLLWRGVGATASRAMLRSLAAWVNEPLAGIAMTRATGPPAFDANPPPASSAGDFVVSTSPVERPTGFAVSTGGGDGSTRHFGIREIGGCWWLTF